MQLLRQFIFEVELSETEELKMFCINMGVISQRKTIWRESFRIHGRAGAEMEQNRRAAALPAAIE